MLVEIPYEKWLTESLPGVSEYPIHDPWRLKVMSQNEFYGLTLEEQLYYLGGFMVLSPTTHNTVSERLRFLPEERAIEIWTDRDLVLPESDGFGAGRQNIISMGCVVQMGVTAGQCYGLKAEEVMINRSKTIPPYGPDAPRDPRYAPVAKVIFYPDSEELLGDGYLRAILERKMMRTRFRTDVRLTEWTIRTMKDHIVDEYPGLDLHVITDPATKVVIGKFQQRADGFVIENEGFARELGNWLLPNDNYDLPRGMRGQEFGLNDAAALRFHQGLKQEIRLGPDEVQGFAGSAYLRMTDASAIGVITVKKDDIEHQVQAGRAFIDLALFLETWGKAMDVTRAKGEKRGEGISDEAIIQGGISTSVHAALVEVGFANELLQLRLGTRSHPTVVFRMGIPEKRDRPFAARPYLNEVLLPNEVV
ncbi:hypothetical protein HQ584_08865 [Patescibacteria group bacterium]|nr:hypothetical protein [Patescibacteria group bacterium]